MNEPKVEYQLEKAVTGKVEKKVPVVLEDKEGNKIRAPWAPKANCKRCLGRGYMGMSTITNVLLPCRKCYPWQ
jgi:hypothetical protein